VIEMEIQYSEKVDKVIYGEDISEIETTCDWINLIIACLDQSDIHITKVNEMKEILLDL